MWQDDAGEWQSMPYEIASAFVRTLAIHFNQLKEAKCAFETCQEADPEFVKAGSVKARTAYDALLASTRHIVMNKRTCQIATQDFISKYIKEENGVPKLKREGTKVQPWIMSMNVTHVATEVELALRLKTNMPFQKVRCLDLKTGAPRGKISALMEGYEDMQDEYFDDEGSDCMSEATMVGDEDGLEGIWVPG